MKTYLYHLEFPAGAHFGRQGIGLEETRETVPSDSLFSGIVNALALLGEAEEVLRELNDQPPPFTLSSLFPFGPGAGNGQGRLYALPRPLTSPPVEDSTLLQRAGKDIKKIRYLQPSDVLRWLGGRPLGERDLGLLRERARPLARPWDAESGEGWFINELRPRVALDRSSQNSSIWWCGVVHFRRGAGLYGLVRIRDDDCGKRLEAAFRLLGDMGLGGERTYGLGTFRFDGFVPLEEVWGDLGDLRKPGRYLLLSRYAPTPEELGRLTETLTAWEMEESRGFVVSGRHATTLKRKRVRFITEGSVATEPLAGRLVDVTPEHGPALGLPHRVYRSGMGFWFP
ncbi:CRISPR-associated protein, Csm4 family [Desulfacinum infernum DSM 9756]|uniref:CRISPR system Cms protein Csm4 n=1 Tax=Desulfacinum infernum DSM 9756 TaxID=1121391 RepID=A0A1M5AUQ5_9BACT|nr:type III-A CRISPR-associated RAMP protein Csm4 [Desulfacinum infernum]SHF33953.1 CRISPR-associated protein, Csm4 family [Desulfacinum infernum DSM 9756]